jgi:hypothetical protein
VLFGIEDEFDVVSVERLHPGQVQIIIEMRSAVAPVSGVWGVHVAGEGPAGAPGQGSARIGAADQAVVAEASIAVR